MIKIFILAIVIVGIGLFAYDQGIKNTLQSNSEIIETKKDADRVSGTSVSGPEEERVPAETILNNKSVLDLSNRGLTQTPKDVFEKTDIQELDLSNNKLTGSLQAEIRHLQNLRVLDLSGNQFTGVPAEIGQLKNLEVLDLSNNRITGLPMELGNLSNLKVLNLKGNEYSEMDLNLIKEKLPATTVIRVE